MAREGGGEEEMSLKPFRLVEPRVRQLVNTVVPRSLVALQQHQENIAGHLSLRDWDRVNSEQINAARTTQQLKDHLKTLRELREQVMEAEVVQFDARVAEVEKQLHTALLAYGVTCVVTSSGGVGGGGGGRSAALLEEDISEGDATAGFEILPSTVADHSSSNSHTQESWEQLKTELDELRDIMTTLTTQVQTHRGKVKDLDQQLDDTNQEVKAGQITLASATKHNIKSYILPVGGAVLLGVVGGLLGGPVGLVAGANIGAAAALTGVAAGSVSGGLLGRRIYKSGLPPEEIELQEVKKKN